MTDTQSLQDLLSKQEELLKSINDKLPPVDLALAEVRLLESIQKQLSSSKDEVEDKARRRLDFLWNVFLQILGVAFVVLFGSFSALAYISAQVANFQSINSNQISLLSLCLANSSKLSQGLCDEVLQHTDQLLSPIISALVDFPKNDPNGTEPTTLSTQSHGLNANQKIGLGLGLGIGLSTCFGLWSTWTVYRAKFRRRRS